jgi:hypothetical protein
MYQGCKHQHSYQYQVDLALHYAKGPLEESVQTSWSESDLGTPDPPPPLPPLPRNPPAAAATSQAI